MINNPDIYINEINDIRSSLKRTSTQLKDLRLKRKQIEGFLYNYMTKNNIDEYKGIKLKSISPKQPIKRKGEKQKRRDILRVLESIGVPDPEGTYDEIKKAQKLVIDVEEE